MGENGLPARSGPPPGRPAGLAGAATALAVAAGLHPVLDTLGRHPEFFSARAAPRRDALLAALLLAVVVPAALWAVVGLLERWSPVGGIAAGVALATSGALFALQTLPALPVVAVVGGALAGGLLTAALVRTPATWPVARWGIVVPLLSIGYFLAVQPVTRVVWGSVDLTAARSAADEPTPVVVVIFDELPTATLMGSPHGINADRYPNFAAFADDAVWYRNTTAVSDHTSVAVPAVLTGMRADNDALPIAADHPQSLYTLLSATHDLHVVEPVTALCPDSLCGDGGGDTASAPSSVASLVEDVRVVGLHVLLPESWTASLPPIDQTWGGFGEDPVATATHDGDFDLAESALSSSEGDRRGDFAGVVRPPDDDGRPPAYVLHTMLPHVPYRYLPSGQQTLPAKLAGLVGHGRWVEDEWLTEHAHRQHLLQTGLADRMLGDVLDDVRDAGLYDDAIIAVVADHGVAFRPGLPRRDADEEILPDVAAVPMFLRYPDGPRGSIDTRPVETIDLVPTIADLLGIEVVEPFDGQSLLEGGGRPAERSIRGVDRDLDFLPDTADPWTVGRTVVARFGRSWDDLYASVDHADLIGRDVADLDVTTPDGLVTVDHRPLLRRLTPESDPVVSIVSGGLAFGDTIDEHLHVAVAFDGTVVAVGRTIELLGDTAPFHALLDPSWFARGVESIDVYVIGPDGALRGPLLDPES